MTNQQHRILFLSDEQASKQYAQQLAQQLHAPLVITFSGDIGAGKTTIIRAILRDLGIQCPIKSPTFSLVESYSCADFSVHHFDLYRIHHEDELEYIGFRDFFSEHSLCFIEWAEHARSSLPNVDICCTLKVKGSGRELKVTALSVAGQKVVACLA
jgi:tRNA threonylcarbamoyladenosine biosynthesis protein TsaE